MPSAASAGWFGCRRALRRPGSPTVVRKRVTTRIFLAAAIRSCTRISLLTAAAISGVRPGASEAMPLRRRVVAQQPVAQLAHRQRPHRREGLGVVRVHNQPRHFVGLVRHYLLIAKVLERQVGQRALRRHALFRARGRHAGQHIAAAQGRGLGQQLAQAAKCVAPAADGVGKDHVPSG